MERVGIRALKNRLGHYIRQVRAGHPIQIIDRGDVVAELVPPGGSMTSADPRPTELARHGLVRLGAPSDRQLYPRLPPIFPPGTAKRLLDEERGDR
jgi:prevent-host-death family protein